MATGALGLALALGGADCLDALPDDPLGPCRAACAVEDTCGFRSEAACLADGCSDESLGGVALRGCLEDAEDCLEAAACACAPGCERLDECLGEGADPGCVDTCGTLVEQQPSNTYRENQCRLQADCADLATCASSDT